jgi:hypothetical protein
MDDQTSSPSTFDNFLALKDHRAWWLAFFALFGLFVFWRFDSRAFPSASIDLVYPRRAITEMSRVWAKQLGYVKPDLIESTEFAPNGGVKTFLEYELGGQRANELMKSTLPVWSWHTRFCRQYDFEEFETWISPQGKLQGFYHKIENNKALPSLSKDEARDVITAFIESGAHISLGDYKLIKSWSQSHLHRTDHSFTWEDQSHEYHDGRLRIQATVSGNLLTQFTYFFYVPEAWERKFSTIRSYNNLFETIASTFYTLLQFISVFIFLWAVSTNKLRWRFAVIVGAVVALTGALDSFNDIASIIADYDPSKPYASYLRNFIIQTLVGMLPQFLTTLVLVGSADVVYRSVYPEKIAMENFFKGPGLRSPSILNFLVIAAFLLAIDLGWVVGYYLIGEKLHFWCPLGIDHYEILSDSVPFFSAIAVGVSAAVNEELLYRVIALGIVQKVTKNFWFANFFQAAAWGFMHSNYPQQPAYARGVELTLGGMLDGWILQRYGLMATLVSHYLFDAILDVKPLWGSTELGLKFSALLPVVPIVILALVIIWNIKKSGPSQDSELQNKNVGLISAEPEVTQINNPVIRIMPHERALPLNRRLLFVLLAIASASLAASFRKLEKVGSLEHVSISRAQALQKADAAMLAHKYSPRALKHVVWMVEEEANGLDLQYIYEHVKLERTLELARFAKLGYMWKVRYFRPLDPEEYTVVIDKYGKEVAFAIDRAEDAPGARLEEAAARQKAEEYLKKDHAKYLPFEFANVTVEKLKNRTDYSFTFKVPRLKVADADFKIYTSVVGDQVSGFSTAWEIPETWTHEREKRTTRDEVLGYIRTGMNLVLSLVLLAWSFGLLRSRLLNWRLACFLAIPVVIFVIIDYLNSLPLFFLSYDTTTPLQSFVINALNGYLQGSFVAFAGSVMTLVFALAALKRLAPTFDLRRFFRVVLFPGNLPESTERKNIWLDSVIIAAAYLAVSMLVGSVAATAKVLISPTVPEDYLGNICSVANVFSPTIDLLHDMFTGAFNDLALVAVGAAIYQKYCRGAWFYFLFIVVVKAVSLSSERYWQDFAIELVNSTASLTVCWFMIRKIAGYNPLVYLLIGAGEVVLLRLRALVEHGQPLFLQEAIVTFLILIAPIIFVCMLFGFSAGKSQGDTDSVALLEG